VVFQGDVQLLEERLDHGALEGGCQVGPVALGDRVAEVAELDVVLDDEGGVSAYRAKLNVSFKYED